MMFNTSSSLFANAPLTIAPVISPGSADEAQIAWSQPHQQSPPSPPFSSTPQPPSPSQQQGGSFGSIYAKQQSSASSARDESRSSVYDAAAARNPAQQKPSEPHSPEAAASPLRPALLTSDWSAGPAEDAELCDAQESMITSLYSAHHSLAKESSRGVEEALVNCATALATLSRYLSHHGSNVKAAAVARQLSHTVEQAARQLTRSRSTLRTQEQMHDDRDDVMRLCSHMSNGTLYMGNRNSDQISDPDIASVTHDCTDNNSSLLCSRDGEKDKAMREMQERMDKMEDEMADMQDRADASEETAVDYAKSLRRVNARYAELETMYHTLQNEHARKYAKMIQQHKRHVDETRVSSQTERDELSAQVQLLQQQLTEARAQHQRHVDELLLSYQQQVASLQLSHSEALAQVQSHGVTEMAELRTALINGVNEIKRIHKLDDEKLHQERRDVCVQHTHAHKSATPQTAPVEQDRTVMVDMGNEVFQNSSNGIGSAATVAVHNSVGDLSQQTNSPPLLHNIRDMHLMNSLQSEVRALTTILQRCLGSRHHDGDVTAPGSDGRNGNKDAGANSSRSVAAAVEKDVRNGVICPARDDHTRASCSPTRHCYATDADGESGADAGDSLARCAAVLSENRLLGARMDAVMRRMRPHVLACDAAEQSSVRTTPREHHKEMELLLYHTPHADNNHYNNVISYSNSNNNILQSNDACRASALNALYQGLLRARHETTAAALTCSAAQRRLAAFTRLQHTMLDKLEQQEQQHVTQPPQDSRCVDTRHRSHTSSSNSEEGWNETREQASRSPSVGAASESALRRSLPGKAAGTDSDVAWGDVPLLDACAALFRYVASSFAGSNTEAKNSCAHPACTKAHRHRTMSPARDELHNIARNHHDNKESIRAHTQQDRASNSCAGRNEHNTSPAGWKDTRRTCNRVNEPRRGGVLGLIEDNQDCRSSPPRHRISPSLCCYCDYQDGTAETQHSSPGLSKDKVGREWSEERARAAGPLWKRSSAFVQTPERTVVESRVRGVQQRFSYGKA